MASGDLTAEVATLGDLPCAVFDGVDDYVEVPHSPRQLGANLANGFTISAWINVSGLGETNNGFIIDKSNSATAGTGFHLRIRDPTVSGYRACIKINSGTDGISGDISYFNVWQHVLVTVSSAQLCNFYVNGVLSGNADQDLVQTISTITTTNAMRIGNRSAATDRTFDGGIREVKMWDKVLTADEIADDYNKGGFIAKDNLIHYFRFDENGYNDYGQVGATLTNSGAYRTRYEKLDVKANVSSLTLPAVTDKLVIIPISIRDKSYKVISVARAA